MKMNRFFMLTAVLFPVIIAGCGAEETAAASEISTSETVQQEAVQAQELLSRDVFAMDTYMTISAYGEAAEAALDEAEAELIRLDTLLAAEDADSEIGMLNAGGEGAVSADTLYLVSRAQEIHEMTSGAFEIAIYPVKQAWGFTDQNYRVPGDDEIEALLPLADSKLIRIDEKGKQIKLERDGMAIDFGGIAKGYASERLTEIFDSYGVKGLINLGGNVQAWGEKADGSDWRVGIRMPETMETAADYIGVVSTHEDAVITSGGYERYFEQGGKIYHHILDPETGRPSASGLVSVTIVSKDGVLADGLSTALYVAGLEKASDIWVENKDTFDMILLDADGQLYVTEGLQGAFDSEMEITWIHSPDSK